MTIATKRVYAAPSHTDGARVLVDRLWPRGLTKEAAELDVWLKDIAPSHELRKWFHARPSMWAQFRDKYLQELRGDAASAALEELYALAEKHKNVTLLFASKNLDQNNATVLKELLDGAKKPPRSTGPAHPAALPKAARAKR
jgi:uncharacterized protein YeaO (DUF488 family)